MEASNYTMDLDSCCEVLQMEDLELEEGLSQDELKAYLQQSTANTARLQQLMAYERSVRERLRQRGVGEVLPNPARATTHILEARRRAAAVADAHQVCSQPAASMHGRSW